MKKEKKAKKVIAKAEPKEIVKQVKPTKEKKQVKEAGENSIVNQLDSFIPEVIIIALGLAGIVLMILHFAFARAFILSETIFGYYGMLFDLIIFDICVGVTGVGGVANLLIYIFTHKKDKNQIPHQIALASSVVFLVFTLVLSLIVFVF